jgi:hypothetical protein
MLIMKKSFFTSIVFMGFMLPLLSQVDHDYNPNDKVPDNSVILNKDQIPSSVLKAFKTTFDLNNPASWTKFPYALKEYGWVYDKDAFDVKPDRYEVSLKTKEGNDFYAVYSAEGNLIATREVSVNAPVPTHVLESLSKSKYKDWKIVENKEVIRYYHDPKSVEQHFRLTVEKDSVRRSISFNYQETANK